MINFEVYNYIEELVRNICEETGHVCPRWIDKKKAKRLYKKDKEDNGSRLEEYEKTCHRPVFTLGPISDSIESAPSSIKCQSLNPMIFHRCDYKNDEAAKKLKEEFVNIYPKGENK